MNVPLPEIAASVSRIKARYLILDSSGIWELEDSFKKTFLPLNPQKITRKSCSFCVGQRAKKTFNH